MKMYQTCLTSHKHCIICSNGKSNPNSLQVKFHMKENDVIEGSYTADHHCQGYVGLLHGGIASTLLDSAMTHYLMSLGVEALTAELNVRFHSPIYVGDYIDISANLITKKRKIFHLQSTLSVGNKICSSAEGKFIQPQVDFFNSD